MRISDWSSDVCSSDLRRRKSDTGGARQIAAAFIGFVAGKGGPCGRKAHMIGDLVLADFTQAGGAVCVKSCASEPRSEERRGGNECVSTCSSRRSTIH